MTPSEEDPESNYFAYKLFQGIAVLVMLFCAPILFSIGFDSAPKFIAKIDGSRKQAIDVKDTEELEGTCNPSEQTDL